jgi:dipeptidyl aminopeptidase/acylaminoacyl peptidase
MSTFSADDLYQHRVLSALHAHCGSSTAVFLCKRATREDDSYRNTVWAWLDGRLRRLTDSKLDARWPRVSPEGSRMAFLGSDANGDPQVHVQQLAEGTGPASPLGGAAKELQGVLAWSPDGRRLLLKLKLPWKEDAFDDTQAGEDRPRASAYLPIKKDGGGFLAGYRVQCDVLDVATGTRQPLLRGDFDVLQAAWSPDGTRLVYLRTADGPQRHFTEVWVADADARDARLLSRELAQVSAVSWSPDAARLALAGSMLEGDSISELWLMDASTGRLERATDVELQHETGDPVWAPEGDRIAIVAARRGLHQIVVVDLPSGEIHPIEAGLHHVKALSANAGGLVYIAATMRTLNELYRIGWPGRDQERLSSFNRAWFKRKARPQVSLRTFTVPDGSGGDESVQAWLLRPSGSGPWPVYMDFHGGPQSTALIDYASHAYWYELVSRGWLVVAPNCVGSGSYSFEFARRLRGRWGELDLPQHLAILQQLREAGLAGGQAGCGGKSYGGFLGAWVLGHTHEFSSVVISAPVANMESHTGTSDSGYYVGPYALGGEITEIRDVYRALSPIEECATTRAQVLLLQGESDYRCPLGQSEEIFAHLLRCGRPAKLVVYPGGDHGLAGEGKPSHRVDFHRRFAAWVAEMSASQPPEGSAVTCGPGRARRDCEA